jgi:hypothetical protein
VRAHSTAFDTIAGFWGDGVDGQVASAIWDYCHSFQEIDKLGPAKGKGTELDQFWR